MIGRRRVFSSSQIAKCPPVVTITTNTILYYTNSISRPIRPPHPVSDFTDLSQSPSVSGGDGVRGGGGARVSVGRLSVAVHCPLLCVRSLRFHRRCLHCLCRQCALWTIPRRLRYLLPLPPIPFSLSIEVEIIYLLITC